jgi:hypothetical protein
VTVKQWNVGDVLTSGDMNSWTVPLAVYKTATTIRNTLTLSLDPDLQFTIATANSFWEIRASVIYTASAGSFKWTWTAPSGFTGGYSAGLAQATPQPLGLAWGATASAATDGTVYAVQIQWVLGISSTTGTFGIQWASNSGPNSITVGVGSYLLARRIG